MHGVGFEPTTVRMMILCHTHLANPCYTLTGGTGQLKVVGPKGGAPTMRRAAMCRHQAQIMGGSWVFPGIRVTWRPGAGAFIGPTISVLPFGWRLGTL